MSGPYSGSSVEMSDLPSDIVQQLLLRTERKGRCRVWTGCCAAGTSPAVTIKRQQIMVRRIMYASTHDGTCPAKTPVSTTCSTPLCVAPAHMRSWSSTENSPRTPLAQVKKVRRLWNASKHSLSEICELTGLSRHIVYRIAHNETYADPLYVPNHVPQKRGTRNGRLDAKVVMQYRRRHARGERLDDMIARTGIPRTTLHNALHGATWGELPVLHCCCIRGRRRLPTRPGERWCSVCRRFRPLESFHRGTGSCGRQHACKSCTNERARERRRLHREAAIGR